MTVGPCSSNRTRLRCRRSGWPARSSGLFCSFHLLSERKPVPERHLAVQRRARRSVSTPANLRVVARGVGRDAAGRRRVPVSAGQRHRLGAVAWDPHHTVRYDDGFGWPQLMGSSQTLVIFSFHFQFMTLKIWLTIEHFPPYFSSCGENVHSRLDTYLSVLHLPWSHTRSNKL